jgi:hypothetical protein
MPLPDLLDELISDSTVRDSLFKLVGLPKKESE